MRSSTRSFPIASPPARASPSPALSSRGSSADIDGYKGGDLLGLTERLDELADLGITAIYVNPVFMRRIEPPLQHLRLPGRSTRCSAAMRRCASCSTPPTIAACGSSSTECSTTSAGASGRSTTCSRPAARRRTATGSTWSPRSSTGRRGLGAYGVDATAATRSVRLPDRGGTSRPCPSSAIEHPEVREYLLGVAEHWLRFGIDGWRLDVPRGRRGRDVLAGVPASGPGRQSRTRTSSARSGTRAADWLSRRPLRRADELPARAGDPRVRRRRSARHGDRRRPVELPRGPSSPWTDPRFAAAARATARRCTSTRP